MGQLFHSLKEIVRRKLEQPAREQRSSPDERSFVGRSTVKEAEQAPPERVGEIVGHSSGG